MSSTSQVPANFPGSPEEWERLQEPLRELDPQLSAFAERWDMELASNAAGWPERSLVWFEGVERRIQSLFDPQARSRSR